MQEKVPEKLSRKKERKKIWVKSTTQDTFLTFEQKLWHVLPKMIFLGVIYDES